MEHEWFFETSVKFIDAFFFENLPVKTLECGFAELGWVMSEVCLVVVVYRIVL